MGERLRLVGPIERALYLKTIPSVAAVEPSDLAELAGRARERVFRRGTALLRRGEPVSHVYIVVEGRVQVAGGGRPKTAGPRDTVGVLSVLSRSADGIEATAEVDTLTLEVDAEALLDLFEDHFSALLNQVRSLAGELLAERRGMGARVRLSPWGEDVVWRQPLDFVERLVLLRRTLPFRTSGIDALAELARGMTEVGHASGARIWSRDEPSGFLLLLVRGTVSCVTEGESGSFEAGPGYPLGNLESLAGEPRWYDALATTPVVALRAETEAFLDVLEDHFETAMDFVAAMAGNLLSLRGQGEPGPTGNRPQPAPVDRGGEVPA